MIAPRVLIYVQYLQGVGHLYRVAAIAKAMMAMGLDVHIVSGGMPVPGLDYGEATIHQLTPIKCRDGNFKDLITDDGHPLDDRIKDMRRGDLLDIFNDVSPDAVVIEAFPFGRRQMRFELQPFLEACRGRSPKSKVVCSVRDILQVSGKPGRADEIADTLLAFFDHILVHGDPKFVALDETFSSTSAISNLISYTGIVTHAVPPDSFDGAGDILISAGGGATQSEMLLNAALDAQQLSSAFDRHWRLMAGPNLPEGEFDRLVARTPEGVTVERNRSDFKSLMANCAVSVSQAGYNTVADILQARCRAVLVPYAAKGETEQSFRAEKLMTLGRAEMIRQDDLTPASLAVAIDAALAKHNVASIEIDLTGAATSAAHVAEWLGKG